MESNEILKRVESLLAIKQRNAEVDKDEMLIRQRNRGLTEVELGILHESLSEVRAYSEIRSYIKDLKNE